MTEVKYVVSEDDCVEGKHGEAFKTIVQETYSDLARELEHRWPNQCREPENRWSISWWSGNSTIMWFILMQVFVSLVRFSIKSKGAKTDVFLPQWYTNANLIPPLYLPSVWCTLMSQLIEWADWSASQGTGNKKQTWLGRCRHLKQWLCLWNSWEITLAVLYWL